MQHPFVGILETDLYDKSESRNNFCIVKLMSGCLCILLDVLCLVSEFQGEN